MYFSLFQWDLDGGVQVTGSHNPADYNGFKVCLGQEALHGEQIQELRRRVESVASGPAREPRRAVPSWPPTRTISDRPSARSPARFPWSSTLATARPARWRR